MRLLLILFLLYGCGYLDEVKPEEDEKPDTRMEDLYNLRLAQASQWTMGWPSLDDCDGLVWAGVACAAGVDVDIGAAFVDGRFYRTPDKTCFLEGRSRSTISNDGMVSAMACAKTKQDKDMLRQMSKYGEDNNWVYGEPWPKGLAEVYLKPHFQGLLGRLTEENKSYSKIPFILKYSEPDYVAHIQTLAMWTQIKQTGHLSTNNIDLLKRYHQRDPGDYLIRSLYGLYNKEVNSPFTDVQPPSYVRGSGAERFALAHWLLAAKIYLNKGD